MPIAISNLITSTIVMGAMTPRIWYSVPLIVVVSLVYGATRHENLKEIFVHSFRSAVWVLGFMAIIFGLIWIAGFWN
ncbi:MAG: hypothetical protein AB8B55_04335 [Mariniblastus sp.]